MSFRRSSYKIKEELLDMQQSQQFQMVSRCSSYHKKMLNNSIYEDLKQRKQLNSSRHQSLKNKKQTINPKDRTQNIRNLKQKHQKGKNIPKVSLLVRHQFGNTQKNHKIIEESLHRNKSSKYCKTFYKNTRQSRIKIIIKNHQTNYENINNGSSYRNNQINVIKNQLVLNSSMSPITDIRTTKTQQKDIKRQRLRTLY